MLSVGTVKLPKNKINRVNVSIFTLEKVHFCAHGAFFSLGCSISSQQSTSIVSFSSAAELSLNRKFDSIIFPPVFTLPVCQTPAGAIKAPPDGPPRVITWYSHIFPSINKVKRRSDGDQSAGSLAAVSEDVSSQTAPFQRFPLRPAPLWRGRVSLNRI